MLGWPTHGLGARMPRLVKKMLNRMVFSGLVVLAGSCTLFAQNGPDLSAIDKSADPCENFYQYACGAWQKGHPIPGDESRYGRFNELLQRNQEILRGILEDSAKNQSRSETDQKIGGFYQSCMDEEQIERRGTKPLQPELDRIANIHNAADLLATVAWLHGRQVSVFFHFVPQPDLQDACMMIASLDQGGLGLPDRDYYFRTDARSVDLRKQYVAAVTKMFTLAGVAPGEAASKAAHVMAIETELARASLDRTTRRDPQKLFHQMSEAELMKLSPNFQFDEFFKEVKAPALAKINVAVPDFVKAFNTVVSSHPMPELKDYLAWHYLRASANILPKAFADESFAFYGRALTGQKEMKPRWRRCVAATDDELGEALGRKYVEKTFGEQGKQRTLEMVREIEQEMAKDVQSLDWMSAKTKEQALAKLHAVTNKIGYPDKWRDYSSVKIAADDYFGNWYRANEFEYQRELKQMGKPVDRDEWEMTPPTVNAYYEPTQNNINFPAGILQPPFYSNQASDALNYGSVGAVVGHELTHAFDDSGRQFDREGNLKDWWEKEDGERFDALAQCTVNEYGSFSPITGVELNGKLTLGENTADNGGVRLAYMALMDSLAKKGVSPDQKNGEYTPAQEFFVGYAQDWCENTTPEMARFLAQNDPHSPGKFRTNGVVKNMSEFSKAFGCKPGDAMYVAQGKGCRVW